jgi:hypothetical protein
MFGVLLSICNRPFCYLIIFHLINPEDTQEMEMSAHILYLSLSLSLSLSLIEGPEARVAPVTWTLGTGALYPRRTALHSSESASDVIQNLGCLLQSWNS